MATHAAVVTVGVGQPLAILQVPTVRPQGNEVRVRSEWTASTPLDLHQNDGGLLVKHPQVLGDGVAGTVLEVGPDVERLEVGDKVFGFAWRKQAEKAHQESVTAEDWQLCKLPDGFSLREAVTLPNNFVTVFHAFTADLDVDLPWPKPSDFTPNNASVPILIWGGSSSVGQFAIQILHFYGYRNILVTASPKHHERLRILGAARAFDYREPSAISSIVDFLQGSPAPLILDCIGSQAGSVQPVASIAKRGARVAILLPVIVKDPSQTAPPVYEMDVAKAAKWANGVVPRGVRTHFYPENEFFKQHLQPEIMYALLKDGIVRPNAQKVIEGTTLLERAQKAMDALRAKDASMERLVWRVSEL